MTSKLLQRIRQNYPFAPVDAGDMAAFKAKGMKFTVEAYQAEGQGRVSVMHAKGFFGLMKMDTLIINPYNRELPLYSYDRIYAAGNDTLIVELYDTLSGEYSQEQLLNVKEEYADLPERDPGKHWYDQIKLPSSISKKGKRAQSPRFDEFTLRHFEAWMEGSRLAENRAVKQTKAAYYVEGLLTHGGPSTDVFQKALGRQFTETLFRDILFGTSRLPGV